ncbi:acrylyl-CoA reductase family protein [Desulforhopalus singaporensis]|uniref:Putative quinone oxidoreductase, YhdH/YhfP family n=1 Tax=Desulforhopalus singaporensis TaxID=91360 RepID=A0A1H0V171_9BACT|nr:acryloyl-CoA reductase [Desulforhopalus singaporensis]SDP72282.1 putative quinone oxidoreductase, YhdH/YhfP family [Desulforhopalus singaporensis]
MKKFSAFRIKENEGKGSGEIVECAIDELDAGDVVIKTAYAGVNYKDALAGLGMAKIIERYPCIGGIEAVGVVVESKSAAFKEGDKVIVHGRGIGVKHDGGFSEYVRVPAEWVIPLPRNLEMLEAATLGVAGHTAAVSINEMERNGLKPENGPIAVTGATGGAASLSIDMLSGLGYEVVAVTRKKQLHDYLNKLGARRIIATPEDVAVTRHLEKGEWAGAIDTTGGHVLAWLLRTTAPDGVIASFGNTAGIELQTTVFPFILRGVRLLGINSNTEIPFRKLIWERMATDLKPRHIKDIVKLITFGDLPEFMRGMLKGETQGRYVVAFDESL